MTLQELMDQNRVEKITEFNIETILAELDENGIDLVIVNVLPFYDHLFFEDGMYHLNYDSFAPEEIREVLLGFGAVYKIKGEENMTTGEKIEKHLEEMNEIPTLNIEIDDEQLESLFKTLLGEKDGAEFFKNIKEIAEEVAEKVVSSTNADESVEEYETEEDEYCEECETEEDEITLGDVILEILERIDELDETLDRIENKVDVLLGENFKGCCRRHQ